MRIPPKLQDILSRSTANAPWSSPPVIFKITRGETCVHAWLIDPLSRPIVRAITFSDALDAQVWEMVQQFQNYDVPRIAHMLPNNDVLLVSDETWKATGWFFRFKGKEFFGRGIVCGPPVDLAYPAFTSAKSATLIQLLNAAGGITWGNLPQRGDA